MFELLLEVGAARALALEIGGGVLVRLPDGRDALVGLGTHLRDLALGALRVGAGLLALLLELAAHGGELGLDLVERSLRVLEGAGPIFDL